MSDDSGKTPAAAMAWRPLPVAAELSGMCILSGKWTAIRTTIIDRDRLFLIAKDYVRPRSLIEIMLWSPDHEEPIYAMLIAAFIERTWEGYGVEAEIVRMTKEDEKAWQRVHRHAVARSTPGYCDSICPAAVGRTPYVLVMEHTLARADIDALLARGIDVEIVATTDDAEKIAARGDVDLVIGAQLGMNHDGLSLCRSLAALRSPPRSLLVTARGTASDFESCLYAGATKVVASPYDSDLLVTRIIEVLSSEAAVDLDAGPQPESHLASEELPDAPISAPHPSLLESLSDAVREPLHLFMLQVRVFLRSSAFERVAAFTL